MPSVEDLTDGILQNRVIARHSDGTYLIEGSSNPAFALRRHEVELVLELLRDLAARTEQYFKGILGRESFTYEDVGDLCLQLADACDGEYENPGLAPLIGELCATWGLETHELRKRAYEARGYMRDYVATKLAGDPERVDYLGAITDACAALPGVDLFNLNHDRVLELALDAAGIEVADGFGEHFGQLNLWNNSFAGPISHCQLHGSVRWWPYMVDRSGWAQHTIARATTTDVDHAIGPNGEPLGPTVGGRPALLVGTMTKSLAYQGQPFADQHLYFQQALARAPALVTVGYGFRDKGINTRLINWMGDDPNRRLIVVDPDPPAMLRRARGAIERHSEQWLEIDQMRLVAEPAERATWEEIASELPPGSIAS